MKYLRREPGFYRRLFLLALPLILQNLITTSLGFVDTFMVGLLGSDQLSAVTAANAPIFLIQVIIFGLMSGLTILVSQYWGKQDIASINRCMGFAMYAGLAISILMAAVLFFFPSQVLSLVTDNRTLIEMGEPYLKIVGISYIFNSVSSVYVSMQRSAENPSLGMKVFAASMLLNTFLNYCLIFGNFGAPNMGITGAAIATLTSRIVEFLLVLLYALFSRALQRDHVGSGHHGDDFHPGPYGRQRRHAGGLHHYGQHRQVHHRLLFRSGGRHRRDPGQIHR